MKLIRQIILLTLTLLVLVSSTGLAVGVHVCGGEISNLSFFGKAEKCPMEKKQEEVPTCHGASSQQKTTEDDCCKDHTLKLEAQDDIAATAKTVLRNQSSDFNYLAAASIIIQRLFAPEVALETTYTLYSSPPLARDIPVFVQSFLL